MTAAVDEPVAIDLDETSVRALNRRLHGVAPGDNQRRFVVANPRGKHALACGLDAELEVRLDGHVGFYCAGMNKHARVEIAGHAGPGVAENMMSGRVHVRGNASQSAGATGRGGLLVIDGDAAGRCGISMKGIDIVVAGSVGHMSAFMAQKGTLVVCGDAGEGLGDSIYEAEIFVAGTAHGLGADCEAKPMDADARARLADLLQRAGVDRDPDGFTRYGSARQLYNFKIDNADSL
jgi:glutamate synthase domain-containing protein 3